MRTLLFLLALALTARAQMHPSLPEPGTLDGLGVNIHFTEPQPGELEMIRAAGFRWVRMDFSWQGTEPEAGRYDFAKYDALLAALEKAGLRAYFILDYGHPKFADAGDRQPFTSRAGTQEFRDAFAKWAVAAVGHFKGRGIVWELWNEPNIAFGVPPSGGLLGVPPLGGLELSVPAGPPKGGTPNYIALAKTVSAALEKAGLRGKSRTFPGGTKREAAGECLVGPATSVIDLPFLDACFAAGLLEVFDAISVHPYRQGAPESVAGEYRALRLLIRRHCAADALPLGTYDPSRPNPARRIPILSGEWGWSAAWPSLGKDEAAREATQAKYLPRMFLTNVANDIPLSIWYDWRDDGDDPKEAEHRFGIVRRKPTGDARQPFEPKPAYTAMEVMCEELKGMRFKKDLQSDVAFGRGLLFSNGKKHALSVWRPSGVSGELSDYFGVFSSRGITGEPPTFHVPLKGRMEPDRKAEPLFIQLISPPLHLSVLSTMLPSPLEVWTSGKSAFELSTRWENPTELAIETGARFSIGNRNNHPQCMLDLSWPEMKTLYAGSSQEIRDKLELSDGRDGWYVTEEIAVRGQGRSPHFSTLDIPVVLKNGLTVRMLPSSPKRINVQLFNPSGEQRSGVLEAMVAITSIRSNFAMADPFFRVPKTRFSLRSGQRIGVFTIVAKDSESLNAKGRNLADPNAGPNSVFDAQYRWVGVRVRDAAKGDTAGGGNLILMPGFACGSLTIHTDGDAAVASTQSLADGQPAEGASVSGTPSVGLRYRFGAGWKFVRIEPKDAAARKIEGGPGAFGIWVHGDGQGGTPGIRLRDATGQTHQVRGEPVSWKGWRYVTFPLRPAADSGQTMIPLPDAGAEQRVSWGHWGGANDGEVHLPIEWDTLFLLDGNRRAMEGEIFLSAPTLVY